LETSESEGTVAVDLGLYLEIEGAVALDSELYLEIEDAVVVESGLYYFLIIVPEDWMFSSRTGVMCCCYLSIFLVLSLFANTIVIFCRTTYSAMPRLTLITSSEINCSAADAWKLFGEGFADVSTWANSIKASSMDREVGAGAVRTTDDAILGAGATQIMTVFDREGMKLTYELGNGLPAPIAASTNEWTFEVIDATHCRATSVAVFDLKFWASCLAPILKGKMRKGLGGFMQNLKTVLESP